MYGRNPATLPGRFWDKVDQSGDCWVWTASKHDGVYGQIDNRTTHRVSWELHYGPIPDGRQVPREVGL